MAITNAAGVLINELLQRGLHRRLEHAWTLDVAAHAEQFRAAVLFRPEACEPFGAVENDRRQVAQGLDVVDGGRAVVEAGDSRERRLDPRLRALSFERFDQRGLFA